MIVDLVWSRDCGLMDLLVDVLRSPTAALDRRGGEAWPAHAEIPAMSHGDVLHAQLLVRSGSVDWPALVGFLTPLAPDLEGLLHDVPSGVRQACARGRVTRPDDPALVLRAPFPDPDAFGDRPREATLWRTDQRPAWFGVTPGVLLPQEVAIPAFTSSDRYLALPLPARPTAVLVRASEPVVVPGLGTWVVLHGLGRVEIVEARGLSVTVRYALR